LLKLRKLSDFNVSKPPSLNNQNFKVPKIRNSMVVKTVTVLGGFEQFKMVVVLDRFSKALLLSSVLKSLAVKVTW
jgi:hypothetical protein